MLSVHMEIASMRQFQCVPTTLCLFNKLGFHHKLFKTISQPLSLIQRNEHLEMNNFSCIVSCTLMTIIDNLFYASVRMDLRCFMGVYC